MCFYLPPQPTMSGESGRHSRPVVGQQVRPEPVVEKTFVENVAGFINEVSHATLCYIAKVQYNLDLIINLN